MHTVVRPMASNRQDLRDMIVAPYKASGNLQNPSERFQEYSRTSADLIGSAVFLLSGPRVTRIATLDFRAACLFFVGSICCLTSAATQTVSETDMNIG